MRETWVRLPWVGKIPWRRERLPTLVSWPGEFHALYSQWGLKESDITEQLALFTASIRECLPNFINGESVDCESTVS